MFQSYAKCAKRVLIIHLQICSSIVSFFICDLFYKMLKISDQDLHNATIKSLHYYGFNGNKLIGKKNLIERDHCQRCVIKFPRARDYFAHMIKHHVYESVRCQLELVLNEIIRCD